jgi:hypothetical protein
MYSFRLVGFAIISQLVYEAHEARTPSTCAKTSLDKAKNTTFSSSFVLNCMVLLRSGGMAELANLSVQQIGFQIMAKTENIF